ncbi:glycosyltransferase family 2 protein [Thermoflexus sp.]|uniref:glycosyltransferase family 2 protein n=1 Tax=Thermoflexus sp. TaxID=1969742 RepID=UPI002ADE1C3D|nr:glycosyltransferase [Thermoflexus sp.]
MKVAVIIPNLNSPVIDRVVKAVLAQADESLTIWVVGQDHFGLIPSHPQVRKLTTAEHVFPGAARNLGAEQAEAEVLIFLDADCIPQSGWLTGLLNAWKNYPEAGAISGAMLPQSISFIQHCEQIARFHEYLSHNPPGERGVLASFSLLVPYQVWRLSGGFNPHLWATEDLDFTLRLRRMGWRLIFEPKSVVFHHSNRNNLLQFWDHARRNGAYSIINRLRYPEVYAMPGWMRRPWFWIISALWIALVRTWQIYYTTGLWRYWYCMPLVVLHKLAWCLGAAEGLRSIKMGEL